MITCPYCNSQTATPHDQGQRLVCVRCGESFVFKGDDEPVAVSRGYLATAPPVPPIKRRRWSNRAVGVAVLSFMGLMAAGAVVFALLTIDFRRSVDTRGMEDSEGNRVLSVAPKHLPALGYLPKEATVVAGLHVAEAMQEPAGREFLNRFRPMEFVQLPKAAADVLDGASVEQITGLSLDEIDQMVLGATVENLLIPKVYLIARTRKPYDPDKIKSRLKAIASPKPGPKQVFTFDLEKPPLSGVAWFAGKQTLVIGLLTDNLDDVPTEAQTGLAHIAPGVREVLEERMGPAAQAWFVGHVDNWDKTAGKLLLPSLGPKVRPLVEKLKSLGVWLTIREGLTLNGVVQAADVETAEKWDALLVPKDGVRKPIRLFGDQTNLEPVAQELASTLKSVRREQWLTLQAKAKAETVNQALAGQPPR